MTQQSIETSVAVIENQLKHLIEDGAEAKQSRLRMHQEQEAQNLTLLKIDHRLSSLEAVIAANEPTWKEYREMRLKVQGAGWLGRLLWIAGGLMISLAFWLVGTLQKWWHP